MNLSVAKFMIGTPTPSKTLTLMRAWRKKREWKRRALDWILVMMNQCKCTDLSHGLLREEGGKKA